MYALVFEGGGAKGSYQVGACKAIIEKGIPISAVTGTSIGSLNGAMIAQGDFEKLYEIWYDISPSKVLGIDDSFHERIKKLNIQNLFYAFDKTKEILENKGFNTVLIKKIIEDNVDEEKLRKSKVDFGLVTLSLSDGKPLELFKEEIPKGKIHEYLMASANFPAFKQEKIDGKVLVDGGFYNNFPIELLVRKGFTDIIAPRIYGIGRVKKFSEKNLNITYISPSEELGATLDFSNKIARRNLEMGYFDAKRVFDKLKGRKFYIESNQGDDYYLHKFLEIDAESLKEISKKLGFKNKPGKRMLLERIVPRICDLLGMENDADYEDIYLSMAEFVAEQNGVERFRIYDADEFIGMANDKSVEINFKDENLPTAKNIAEDVISFFNGNMLLKSILRHIF